MEDLTEKKVKKPNKQLSMKACTILRESNTFVEKCNYKGKILGF